ncbi:hypothetical protein [Paraburkholderia sp.]|uniref:hypothetical protein n=1 Tax=Paraburkholderia sp. TaxID=1926495 RepID=UPI0039E293B7
MDIAYAAGVPLDALFPPRVDGVHASKPAKRRYNAAQTLAAINCELIEVMLIVGAILRRGAVTASEHARLRLALTRVSIAEGWSHD